jgi:hypothetical protein
VEAITLPILNIALYETLALVPEKVTPKGIALALAIARSKAEMTSLAANMSLFTTDPRAISNLLFRASSCATLHWMIKIKHAIVHIHTSNEKRS